MTQTDYTSPELNPKTLCSWLGIPGNRLGHFVSVTIGAPTEVPKKRGQAGKYSGQDAVCICLGKLFLDMGITPNRIKKCVQAVKTDWDNLYPRDLDVAERSWGSSSTVELFLVGEESNTGFSAKVWKAPDLAKALGLPYLVPDNVVMQHATDAKPRLLLNIGGFVAGAIIELYTYLEKVPNRKKA